MERSGVGRCPMDDGRLEGAKRRSYVIRAKSSWRKAKHRARWWCFCTHCTGRGGGRASVIACGKSAIRLRFEEPTILLVIFGGWVRGLEWLGRKAVDGDVAVWLAWTWTCKCIPSFTYAMGCASSPRELRIRAEGNGVRGRVRSDIIRADWRLGETIHLRTLTMDESQGRWNFLGGRE